MKHKVIIWVFLAYAIAQIIAPAVGLALALNFDTSCYSGDISYLERVNTGNSSCGASGDFVGFPFVINFDYNTKPQQLFVLMLDSIPALFLIAIFARHKNSAKSINHHQ